LFICGDWHDAADGRTFAVVAPAYGAHLIDLAAGSAADVDAAVRAARRQVDGGDWSKLSGSERGRLLSKLAELLERDVDIIATLEALDVGRPASEPRFGDVPSAVGVYHHYAGWADKIEGRSISLPPAFGRERQAHTVRQPVGVIGAVTAWNTPTLTTAWKLAPALATGNVVVLKPAEDASLSTLHLAALIAEAGFPAGTVNIVTGIGSVAGAALIEHQGVDKISFTGSPAVGRQIGVRAMQDFRKVTLELGGKSPQIVLGDVDVAAIAPHVAAMFLLNQDEICAAGTRILADRSIYDDLVVAVGDAARAVKIW
jgi:betaine-aldehyde dehydrogenase